MDSRQKTVTDANGHYRLDGGWKAGDKIEFICIGFATSTFLLKDQLELNVLAPNEWKNAIVRLL